MSIIVHPKIAIISAPYRAPTELGVEDNIRQAEALQRQLIRAGYPTFCPHKNTAHLGGLAPDDVFIEMCLAMIRSIASSQDRGFLVLGENWERSRGAVKEIVHARQLDLPIYSSAKLAIERESRKGGKS